MTIQLKSSVILAANTARSNAYLQALHANNIELKGAVLFADDLGAKAGQSSYVPCRNWPDSPVFLPDLSLPIEASLQKVCGNTVKVNAGHVNDPTVRNALDKFSPDMVIYSGYGSQIVGGDLLVSGAPFLHIHSGWLPDFRGSTTTYYHLLVTGNCGVSAILLEKSIDTGPIVARKNYPRPPAGVDIDYLYDSAIRADLLTQVLEHYAEQGKLPQYISQKAVEGNTFYIIHPILKHIALLSLEESLKFER